MEPSAKLFGADCQELQEGTGKGQGASFWLLKNAKTLAKTLGGALLAWRMCHAHKYIAIRGRA